METILIATLGSEPQVVTLALDKLLANDEPISRVVVVHTLPQLEPIKSSLARLREEFLVRRFYEDRVLFELHQLAGMSGALADVATAQDMDDAFQSLYTLLRQHKQAGRKIHLSIAGGRKTMALFAMAAAQILLDAHDRLWHLTSPPELIATRALHADDPDMVTLIPIPLAHWGHLRHETHSRAEHFLHSVLTPAEREVAQLLISEGLSNVIDNCAIYVTIVVY